jgi:hypothetical protein
MRTHKKPQRRTFRPFVEILESRELLSSNPMWTGFAGNEQHTAISGAAAQPLETIRWQSPVDLQPQFSGNDLLIHYGEPMVSAANTVIIPVKTGATQGFHIEARDGGNGTLKWIQSSNYLLPTLPNGVWTPSFPAVLAPTNRLYFAGAGGTVFFINNPDAHRATISGQFAFYGLSNYQANPSSFNSTIFIDTPLTADSHGDIYFGFRVEGTAPTVGNTTIQSGLARIGADGTGTWISASAATNDSAIFFTPPNAAPALSNNESVVYETFRSGDTGQHSYGYLVALDATTLQPLEKVRQKDPRSGGANDARLTESSTASPMVGPDGDVYEGVFASTEDGSRGFMLHFSSDLSVQKTPGAFGWDDTASIVPASMVPSYHGTSTYLLMTKYNNYAGDCCEFADGTNKIAILDPNATETDPHASSGGLQVMNEVMTILGPSPDPDFVDSGFPNAVREWCINTAVIDPATDSVFANSEDGKLYRWNLTTDRFTEQMTLTPGIGEAYTPTFIGADGTVYAINNATLFAVGRAPRLSVANVTVTQSATASVDATFTVTLANPTNQDVSVPFFTADGTATLGQDYMGASDTLFFPAGTTTQTVNVTILPNAAFHVPRTFTLNLGTPTNAMIGQSQATATIMSAVAAPILDINNVTLTQSTATSLNAVFTVTLTGLTQEQTTVSFNTVDGTALNGRDYSSAFGMLTFNPTQTTQNITVPVLISTADDAPLTFSVVLSEAVNATLDQPQGLGTIMNVPPSISVSSVTAPDGDSGTTPFTFTISLSRPSRRPITVTYATGDGTAVSGPDYTAIAPTPLTFNPNETSKPVTVLVNADTVSKPDKTFFLNLANAVAGTGTSQVPASIAVGQGVGTIQNDDGSLMITDVSGTAGVNGQTQFVFNVRAVHPSTRDMFVNVSTADGSAHAPTDYTAVPLTTLHFMPEQTFANVIVFVNSTSAVLPDRNFFVNLTNPVNTVLVKSQGVGTISNGNVPGTFQFNAPSYTVVEAQGSINIVITRSGGSFGSVSVNVTAGGGTAIPNVEYAPVSRTLTFAQGEISKSLLIPIFDDGQVHLQTTVNLTLSNPTGGAVLGAQSQAVLHIIESDGTANQRFIMQVYRDLLGREVEPGGFQAWTAQLDAGMSRTQVVRMIENSLEYQVKFINGIFLQYLNRPVDQAGLAMGLSILAGAPTLGLGGVVNQLREIILGSPEYFQTRANLTNAGFAQVLYHDVLNRDPDPTGQIDLIQFLAEGGSRTVAAQRFLVTFEADDLLMTNIYNRYLHRQIQPSELSAYEFAMLGEKINELDAVAIVLGSSEYLARV